MLWITSDSFEPCENPQEERSIVDEHEQGLVGADVGKRVGVSELNWATFVGVNVGKRVGAGVSVYTRVLALGIQGLGLSKYCLRFNACGFGIRAEGWKV